MSGVDIVKIATTLKVSNEEAAAMLASCKKEILEEFAQENPPKCAVFSDLWRWALEDMIMKNEMAHEKVTAALEALACFEKLLLPFKASIWKKLMLSKEVCLIEAAFVAYAAGLDDEEKTHMSSKLVLMQAHLKKLLKNEETPCPEDKVVSFLLESWRECGQNMISEGKIKSGVNLNSFLLKRFKFALKHVQKKRKVVIQEEKNEEKN